MRLILSFALLNLLSAPLIAQYESIVTVKSFNCPSEGHEREVTFATGFYARIDNFEGIVTSLHAVCGCDNRYSVFDKSGNVFNNLRIIAADIENDVAIISSPEIKGKLPKIEFFNGSLDQLRNHTVSIAGHPEGRKSIIVKSPKIPPIDYYVVLENLLSPTILLKVDDRGSPSSKVKVLHFDGEIIPGHSGAPILFQEKVVAVTTGYMKGEIGWGSVIANLKLIAFPKLRVDQKYKIIEKLSPGAVYELTASRFSIPIKPFQPSTNFKVLILPFADSIKVQKQKSHYIQLEDSIFATLEKYKHINVRIEKAHEFMPTSFDEAIDLAKEFKSDLVLFGNYLSTDSTNINYACVNAGDFFIRSDPHGVHSVSALSIPETGSLPKDISYIIRWSEAMTFYRQYEFEKCLSLLTELKPKTKDQLEEYHFKLGTIFMQLGDYPKMQTHYAKTHSLNPNEIRTLFNTGCYFFKREMLDSAEFYFNKVYEADISEVDNLTHAMTLYNLDILKRQKGVVTNEYIEKLRAHDRYLYEVKLRERKVSEYLQQDNFDALIEYFNKPENSNYIKSFSNILSAPYYSRGDRVSAKRLLLHTVNHSFFDVASAISLALMYLNDEHNLDSAKIWIDRLGPMDKGEMENYWLIAQTTYFIESGETANAIKSLSNIKKPSAYILNQLMNIYSWQLKNDHEAVKLFETNKAIIQNCRSYERIDLMSTYGVCMARLGNYDVSKKYLREVFINRYDEFSLSWLGYLYNNEPDSVLMLVNESIRNVGSNYTSYKLKGDLKYNKGNYDSALYFYEQAASFIMAHEQYRLCEILYQQAATFDRLGSSESAAERYDRVLDIDSKEFDHVPTYQAIIRIYRSLKRNEEAQFYESQLAEYRASH